jgi:hypothetical protein
MYGYIVTRHDYVTAKAMTMMMMMIKIGRTKAAAWQNNMKMRQQISVKLETVNDVEQKGTEYVTFTRCLPGCFHTALGVMVMVNSCR